MTNVHNQHTDNLYYHNYVKYKTKYLGMRGGKEKNLVIHICGPSGSGKTTLGNKLKDAFGDNIVVKDMDNIMDIFINKHIQEIDTTEQFSIRYQQFIDDYIEQLSKKHDNIIFVGLKCISCW